MAFHFCVDLSAASVPPRVAEGETYIIHVQFYGTGQNDYRVHYEKLQSTLLTEYLRKREGPDFNQKLMKLTFDIAPADKANSFCKSLLERGIFCRQRPYFFLGHSDDQLKKKSCYLMRATHEEIRELLAQFGDFVEEENLGKRARKTGMLFSTLNKTVPLDASEYSVVPDIKGGVLTSYAFTDGCGFMSQEFSSEVQNVFELDYQPSAVQVRYRGFEGMLVLKDDLRGDKVQFHNSMKKFFTPDENMPEDLNFADVVDCCRPYVNGYLDTRMVILLADRGVSAQNLEDLQTGYHELLEGMCKGTAEYFLRFKGEFGLLQDIADRGIDGDMKKRLKVLRKQELDEMEKAAYTRILVPKSRVVFAVCDPYNKLKYGECYFNPTMPEDEAGCFPTGQKFVVTRGSCYHPGDIRVLKLTGEKQGYENLRDCLVLPVKGPRPHAFECFGGNLGGDKFFVSWDKNLVPSVKEKSCDYSHTVAAKLREASDRSVSKALEKLKRGLRSKELKDRQEMLEYFATFSDEIPKMIEGEYMKCAAALGPSSKECRQLSKMLYKADSFTEDTGSLRKELEQMEPSIRSALFSGHPRIDQDVEDASEQEQESPTEITRPSQQPSGTSRRSSINSAASSGSRNDEDAKDTSEHWKERRPTQTTRPFRLSIGSSTRLHR
ncbi:hypothetical protein ACROYT_G008809, partial [Oculina patagonica]